jgi:hypothetical protein
MKREEYLNKKDVAAFIQWMESKLKSEFTHAYEMKKPKKSWSCTSIYDAYQLYDWNGKGFYDNQKELNEYSLCLKDAVEAKNEDTVKEICLKILSWGGVLHGNEEVIKKKTNLTGYLSIVQELLNPRSCDTDHPLFDCLLINSGFTKIYSLLIPDFIIYDSRVGAALCHLVRLYLEEKNIEKIPNALHFSYGTARTKEVSRCPDKNGYKFSIFAPNKGGERLLHNMWANWLLGAVLENKESLFSGLDKQIRLRALEAALFMIGYAIPSSS